MEDERVAEFALDDVGADRVVRGEARHQRDGHGAVQSALERRGLDELGLEEAHPSTAVSTALTTPPNRVAMPPARITCATSPRDSASMPAARASSYPAAPGAGKARCRRPSAARRHRGRRSTRARARRPRLSARSASNSSSSNPKRTSVSRVSASTAITPLAAGSGATRRTARDGRPPRSRSPRRVLRA